MEVLRSSKGGFRADKNVCPTRITVDGSTGYSPLTPALSHGRTRCDAKGDQLAPLGEGVRGCQYHPRNVSRGFLRKDSYEGLAARSFWCGGRPSAGGGSRSGAGGGGGGAGGGVCGAESG